MPPTLIFTVFCALDLKRRRSRLHFVPFLDLERLKHGQTEKCIKILELGGGEAFFATKRG